MDHTICCSYSCPRSCVLRSPGMLTKQNFTKKQEWQAWNRLSKSKHNLSQRVISHFSLCISVGFR